MSTALHPDADLLADLAQTAARAIGVRLVVLFGSTSRGQARPDSDVDIGVLGGGFWDQLRLGSELSLALRREPHVVDLAEASDWLRFEAARDGIPIYEREPRAWSDFKAEAMLAYFDLAPIISICVEGTRRRLLADARARNRG